MPINYHSRRKFITTSAKAGAAITIGSLAGISFLESCGSARKVAGNTLFKTSFDQTSLPYAFNALEPYIDAQTMELHFTKHAAAYSKNLKEAAQAEGVDMNKPLEDAMGRISKYSIKMRNNGGGHYNHELFWKSMKARGEGKPSGSLLTDIETNFRSFADFKAQFSNAAKARFGSGWAWLIMSNDKKLVITSTANQDNPLMDIAETKGVPLLGLDVWEHAYYLKYQNKRADYIDSWWNLVNWDFVQQRYSTIFAS